MQPTAERRVITKRRGFLRTAGENRLRNLLGHLRIVAHTAQRRRVDERQMTLHQLGERSLRAVDVVL